MLEKCSLMINIFDDHQRGESDREKAGGWVRGEEGKTNWKREEHKLTNRPTLGETTSTGFSTAQQLS